MKKMYEKPELELLSFELINSLMTDGEEEDPTLGGSGYDAPPF